jgi:hypothetical protein
MSLSPGIGEAGASVTQPTLENTVFAARLFDDFLCVLDDPIRDVPGVAKAAMLPVEKGQAILAWLSSACAA